MAHAEQQSIGPAAEAPHASDKALRFLVLELEAASRHLRELKKETAQLSRENDHLREERRYLREQNSDLHERNDGLCEENNDLAEENRALRRDMKVLEKKYRRAKHPSRGGGEKRTSAQHRVERQSKERSVVSDNAVKLRDNREASKLEPLLWDPRRREVQKICGQRHPTPATLERKKEMVRRIQAQLESKLRWLEEV